MSVRESSAAEQPAIGPKLWLSLSLACASLLTSSSIPLQADGPGDPAGNDDQRPALVLLRVARHAKASLSDDQAGGILQAMSRAVNVADSNSDTAANVRYELDGSVEVMNVGDGTIDTEAEFKQLLEEIDADIIVVPEVNYCDGFLPGAIGCAPVGGGQLIVERHTAAQEGILWAHEYGHAISRRHRGYKRAIMRSFIDPAHVELSASEAETFSQAATGAQAALAHDGPHVAEPAVAQAALDENVASGDDTKEEIVPIDEFIRRDYVEGVPLEEAARYGREDVPALLEVLNGADPRYRANAIQVLALTQDERVPGALLGYLRRAKRLSRFERAAVLTAVSQLGTVYNQQPSEPLLEVLTGVAESRPAALESLPWASAENEATAQFREQAALAAIRGLALTGHEEGLAALDRMWDRYQNTAIDRPTVVMSALKESLESTKAIRESKLSTREYLINKAAEHEH